jgi:hypothetical protein
LSFTFTVFTKGNASGLLLHWAFTTFNCASVAVMSALVVKADNMKARRMSFFMLDFLWKKIPGLPNDIIKITKKEGECKFVGSYTAPLSPRKR